MSKGIKRVLVLIFLLMVILAGFAIFNFIINGDKDIVEVTVIEEIPNYDYTVTNLDSEYYHDEFIILKNVLTGVLNKDEHVKQIAKLFVIDLYTLDTKVNKYDVGGVDFYHKDKLDMFKNKVTETFYNYIKDNTYGDRNQDLPIVLEVLISSYESSEYTLNDSIVPSYEVVIDISYEDDLGYDDLVKVILVDNTDLIEVVSIEAVEKDI